MTTQPPKSTPTPHHEVIHSLVETLFSVTNALVEAYLSLIIAPMLVLHEQFYSSLNTRLKAIVQRLHEQGKMPVWFTANFVTYARTVLIVPTLVMMSFQSFSGFVAASFVIVLVDFGDFLDGVLARYWTSVSKDDSSVSSKADGSHAFNLIPSWQSKARSDAYGGFIDAVCDKVFIVPVWIFMLSGVQESPVNGLWHRLIHVQYAVLLILTTAEVISGAIRFRAYFTSVGVSVPTIKQGGAIGKDEFSSSAVKADHIGKAKQTFEMIGSAMYVIPLLPFKLFGLLLLSAAVPLAYESVRRKIRPRVIYVHGGLVGSLDHSTLKFWMQSKAMGSKLIVGVESGADSIGAANTLAVSCVDDIVTDVKIVDMELLASLKVNYVVCLLKNHHFVDDEVMKAGKCIMISENGVAQAIGRLENTQVKED